MRRRRRRPKQLELRPRTRGGKREGAGRKPIPGRRRPTAHRLRPDHNKRHPFHLTLRARPNLISLRADRVYPTLRDAIAASQREDFRIVHFSVQDDHIHLICEAADKRRLSSGVRGLVIRMARRVNKRLGRRGKLWGDRYHRRDLTAPREVRNCVVYVLQNFRKHVGPIPFVDPWSSGPWFNGWRDPRAAELVRPLNRPPPVVRAETWLLGTGWRRHGLIDTNEGPADHS